MKYYCIGIKGTGMSTLAQILSDLGNEVSGYDDYKDYKFTQDGLESRNIPIYYDNNHDIDQDTIVTYSVAFSENHPEMLRAKKMGLKFRKYNEIMGDIVSMFETIGVSGTHGKTSTSSMIRHILENTLGCNYFIGAGDGFVSKKNKYYVVEADEFNRHFTTYHPSISIITNIEAEHLECYSDVNDIRDTFSIFANQTKNLVIANGDNEETRKISYNTKVLFYGFNDNNDVVIRNLFLGEEGCNFSLYIDGELFGNFELPLYGKHMVMNATSAILACREIGISKDDIKKYLADFTNAKRRFAISNVGNAIIVDDYAHHPTEIKATIEAVRQKYPNRRVVVVFKPNTYSRTKDFLDDFGTSLSLADKAYLTEIECNRERQEDYPGICSKLVVDKIKGAELISLDTISKLENEKNSVVCFLGCANVDKLIEAFKKTIK